MKYTCKNWLKLTKIAVLSFLVFSSLVSVAQQATQTLSFESDSMDNFLGATCMDLIESQDGGFYFLTNYYLYKIDRFGKLQWQYSIFEIEAITHIDSIYDNVNVAIYTRFIQVFEDKDGVYLFGFYYPNGEQPYYAHLSLDGTLLFDTCYCASEQLYNTDAPIWGTMNRVVIDNANIYYATHVPLHPRYSMDSGALADNYYYSFQVFNKFTGKRVYSYYDRDYTDSAIIIRGVFQTDSVNHKFLAYGLVYKPNTQVTSANYYFFLLDSLGKIVERKPLLPSLNEFTNKGFYPQEFEFPDFTAIPKGKTPAPWLSKGAADRLLATVETNSPKRFYYMIYDKAGNFESLDSLSFSEYGYYYDDLFMIIPNSLGQTGIVNEGYEKPYDKNKDKYVYLDSVGNRIWEKSFHFFFKDLTATVPAVSIYRFCRDIFYYKNKFRYFKTREGGLVYLVRLYVANDTQSYYYYRLYHINHLGWAFGYNPYAYTASDPPASAWFDGEGDLVVQEEMQQWHIRLTDMTGRELYYGSPSRSGFIHFDIPLSGGVYVVSFYEPETGEVWHQKIIKEGYN
ncbi:MAG: hypothetical protein KF882_00420 [Bacteroidia bacterium]|nr:hypothetical protein [Bacteroidia bacterium]MCO5253134.1 hypothetical protein [Bacteroidota bacterium]